MKTGIRRDINDRTSKDDSEAHETYGSDVWVYGRREQRAVVRCGAAHETEPGKPSARHDNEHFFYCTNNLL